MLLPSSIQAPGGEPAPHARSGSLQPLSTAISAIHDLWRGKHTGPDCGQIRVRPRRTLALSRAHRVLDVIDGGADFHLRLYGSQIVDAYRGELTGRSVSDCKPAFREAIVPGYRRCLATREPHYDVLDVEDDLVCFRWERIVLPLALDGKAVDQMMVFSPGLIRGED